MEHGLSSACHQLVSLLVTAQQHSISRHSLRGKDLNLRHLGYEPSELPNCSTALRCLQSVPHEELVYNHAVPRVCCGALFGVVVKDLSCQTVKINARDSHNVKPVSLHDIPGTVPHCAF
jgi:hypothetical protein